jgi:hypothetical protein
MADATDKQMEEDVEKALRGGNPDDAARVLMTYRGLSLEAARAEIAQRLAKRARP